MATKPETRIETLDHGASGDGFKLTPPRAIEATFAPESFNAFRAQLDLILADVRSMLLAKNMAYGNSALDPLRLFSHASPVEQIRVRIDDKLSRIMRGQAAGEDVVDDLIGYLLLLKIAEGHSDANGGLA